MSEPNTEQSILNEGIPVLHFQIAPSQVIYSPVDKTLSISEMPADAKATGDAIQNVKDLLDDDIAGLASDIVDLRNDLTEDIDEIQETLASLSNLFYPVGSVYVTIETSVPERFTGTWVEIAMPTTWNDLKRGTRSYVELESDPERTVHFFLRTE